MIACGKLASKIVLTIKPFLSSSGIEECCSFSESFRQVGEPLNSFPDGS
jgi:hypothetical protein